MTYLNRLILELQKVVSIGNRSPLKQPRVQNICSFLKKNGIFGVQVSFSNIVSKCVSSFQILQYDGLDVRSKVVFFFFGGGGVFCFVVLVFGL